MRVDLEKALAVSDDCMQSRARLKSIMRDLYPEEKREVNILLNVYESGAPSRIAKQGYISKEEYPIFLKKIINEYAMQEYYAMQALDAWIDVLLGKGTAAGIKGTMTGGILHVDRGDDSLYSFQETTNGYAITRYKGRDEAVLLLPDTYHRKPVTRIAREAFAERMTIKHIFLGRNTRVLEEGAFRGCRRLEAVHGSEQLEYIGDAAFSDCENLSQIKLSDPVYYLGKQAFSNTAVTSFAIPESLDYISTDLFQSCRRLKSVAIHDRVIALGAGCFMGCRQLDDAAVPDSVTYIGPSAFLNCPGTKESYVWQADRRCNSSGGGFGSLEDQIGILVKMRWKSDRKENTRKALQTIEESGDVIVEQKEEETFILFKNPSRISRHMIDGLLAECFRRREPNSPELFVVPYTKAQMVGKY
jgi:hypothetical protein